MCTLMFLYSIFKWQKRANRWIWNELLEVDAGVVKDDDGKVLVLCKQLTFPHFVESKPSHHLKASTGRFIVKIIWMQQRFCCQCMTNIYSALIAQKYNKKRQILRTYKFSSSFIFHCILADHKFWIFFLFFRLTLLTDKEEKINSCAHHKKWE